MPNILPKPAVLAIRMKTDKRSLCTSAYQIAQITTTAVYKNFVIEDCIVTFGGLKDLLREVKAVDGRTPFSYLLIYSPVAFTQSPAEYRDFVSTMAQDFQITVLPYR